MSRYPSPSPAAPSITGTVRIDATHSATWMDQLTSLSAAPRGVRVVVNVADVRFCDLDCRSISLLAEYATERALQLDIQGSADTVREWIREIRAHWSPRPRARHLAAVPTPPEGDDAG